MSSPPNFKTLVILDLETTGLIYDEPKITELAMIAVHVDTLEQMKLNEQLPRVMNKFVKLFDPVRLLRSEVVELTGLTNRMLMDYAPFNRETVIAMEAFLSDFQQPMCFVAHNGNQFDFPILFNEIRAALSVPPFHANQENLDQCCSAPLKGTEIGTQTILTREDHTQTSLMSMACADSIVFFRRRWNLTAGQGIPVSIDQGEGDRLTGCVNSNAAATPESAPSSAQLADVDKPVKYVPSSDPARQQPSMKLVNIYAREFNLDTSSLTAHRAEDDCLMLLAILKRYLDEWLPWIETHHQPLSHFSSMGMTTTAGKSPSNDLVNA